MPEMSGLDTLKEMMQATARSTSSCFRVRNEVGTVVEAIRIGAHDYLTKPFREDGAGRGDAEVAAEEAIGNGESGAARLLPIK